MVNGLILSGLILSMVGAYIAIMGTLWTYAARIKQRWSDIEDSWKKQRPHWVERFPCHIAKKIGSDDPLDTEDYTIETFKRNFWAFVLLFLGFLFQAVGVFIYLVSK